MQHLQSLNTGMSKPPNFKALYLNLTLAAGCQVNRLHYMAAMAVRLQSSSPSLRNVAVSLVT